MPDRPDDFERDVRAEMDDMAGEASPSPTAPPGVLRSARRRLARNSAALVVALAMLTGGVVVGVQLIDRDKSNPPVAPTELPATGTPTCDANGQQGGGPCTTGTMAPAPTTAPSPVPTTAATESPPTTPTAPEIGPPGGGTGTGPVPVMLFIDGGIYRYLTGTKGLAAVLVGSIPDSTATGPPVATPHGIVVLGGRTGRNTHLWLLRPGGGVEILDEGDIEGFAVSPDGMRVAYAVVLHGRSQLTVTNLATGSSSVLTPLLDGPATAVGYVGDRVLFETGDGAGAGVATWAPGAAPVPVNGYGSAVETDPETGLAVLNRGDGTCWNIVRIDATGRAHGTSQGDECGSPFVGVSFEPGGQTFAGVELRSDERSGTQIVILAGVDSQLGGALDLPGPFQTWWVSRGRYLVMAENEPGHLVIRQCRVSENMCPNPPVWEGTTAGGDGTAWIVEERLGL